MAPSCEGLCNPSYRSERLSTRELAHSYGVLPRSDLLHDWYGVCARGATTGAVGGIAELPDAALAPLEAGSSGPSGRVVAGVAAAVAALAPREAGLGIPRTF